MGSFTAWNVKVMFINFVIVFSTSFLFGYNIGSLNNIKDDIIHFFQQSQIKRYNDHSPVTDNKYVVFWQLTNALFIPGGVIGASIAGNIADRIGRKNIFYIGNLFMIGQV